MITRKALLHLSQGLIEVQWGEYLMNKIVRFMNAYNYNMHVCSTYFGFFGGILFRGLLNISEVSKWRYSLYSALRSSNVCFAVDLGLPFCALALALALEQLALLSTPREHFSILSRFILI